MTGEEVVVVVVAAMNSNSRDEGIGTQGKVSAHMLPRDEEEEGVEHQGQRMVVHLDVMYRPRDAGHQPPWTMKGSEPSNVTQIQWLNGSDRYHMVNILVNRDVPLVRISHLLAFIPRSWGS